MSADNLKKLQCIVSFTSSILWVTQAKKSEVGPMHSVAAGFIRCLQDENLEKAIVSLKLQNIQSLNNAVHALSKVMNHMRVVDPTDRETEYLEVEGRLCISRAIHNRAVDGHIARKMGEAGRGCWKTSAGSNKARPANDRYGWAF